MDEKVRKDATHAITAHLKKVGRHLLIEFAVYLAGFFLIVALIYNFADRAFDQFARNHEESPAAEQQANERSASIQHSAKRICEEWRASIADAHSSTTYRWRTTKGEFTFGPRPPQGVRAENVASLAPDSPELLAFILRRPRTDTGALFKELFELDARGVGLLLAGPLAQRLQHVTLEAGLVARTEEGALPRYANGRWRYRFARASAMDRQRSLARRETMRALLTALYGPMPPWLLEGLGAVSETLSTDGRRLEIRPHPDHAAMLRRNAGTLDDEDLTRLLRAPAGAWPEEDVRAFRSLAWGLVHILLESPEGRFALEQVLEHQALSPCGAVDSVEALEMFSPGGLTVLAHRWRLRSRNMDWQPLSF